MLKPLGDRILVSLDLAEEKTESGLIIPDSAQDKGFRGVVLAVGDDVKEIEAGFRVLIGKYSGVEMNINDRDCVLLREEDTLAIEV